MKIKIAILFCVEKGLLEQQAKLLISSYFKFASNKNFHLIAVSPREECQPSKNTKQYFKTHNVLHLTNILNTMYLDYPIANKVLSCDFFEKRFPEFTSIIFIDTDTVFLNSIENILYMPTNKLYVRPVDNKGPGSSGDNDINDTFWQNIFKLFNLKLPDANLTTTVRAQLIRPYFNAGFIWVSGIPKFFQQWKKDFVKLVNSGLRPFDYKSRDNTDFRCLDQVALAVTAQRYKCKVEILPNTYNYPIPFKPILESENKNPNLNKLVHIHYHKWFQHPEFLNYIVSEEDKKTEQFLWLNQQLPLSPLIKVILNVKNEIGV